SVTPSPPQLWRGGRGMRPAAASPGKEGDTNPAGRTSQEVVLEELTDRARRARRPPGRVRPPRPALLAAVGLASTLVAAGMCRAAADPPPLGEQAPFFET